MELKIMNGTYDNALTINNLIQIGIYEEVYALYSELCKIACEQDKTFLKNDIYKKSLNDFFTSYYQIFADKKFHINDEMLASLVVFSMQRAGSKDLSIRLVTFSEFLVELERLLIFVFKKKENKRDPATRRSDQEVLDDLHNHIINAITSALSKNDILSREHHKYSLNKEANTILVYTNLFNLKCYRNKHHLKLIALTVETLKSSLTYNLPVTYCEECGTFFIGKTTLSAIQQYAGVILAKFQDCTSDFCYDSNFDQNNESELHICGYNVVSGNYSSNERKELLKYIIDNNIMSIPDIIRDIEKAMRPAINRPNYQNAIKAWEDDLVFVSYYSKNNIIGKGIIKN